MSVLKFRAAVTKFKTWKDVPVGATWLRRVIGTWLRRVIGTWLRWVILRLAEAGY